MKTKILFFSVLFFFACNSAPEEKEVVMSSPETSVKTESKIPVIFDTDANNELDDQHALAYLLFNGNHFDVLGVTVNATFNGGDIIKHYEEAERVMRLCKQLDKIHLIAGANGDFDEIKGQQTEDYYDGKPAVEFMIKQARKVRDQKLVLLPVGKLTNVALALKLAPDIKDKVRIVWLGSNYPEKGEYNQDNDESSMNYILDQDVPFEIVMVRYGKPSGSDAVRATPTDIAKYMPKLGPQVEPVMGRHKGRFTNFGDYSVNLFSHAELHGDPPSRALFDMVAVAILKKPEWGNLTEIPAPILVDGEWRERPDNPRKIMLWENFKSNQIMTDFYEVMRNPVLVK